MAPHPDDAALSCAALLDGPFTVDVLTVFAGSPNPPRQGFWDARCGFASSKESLPVRRSEEERALESAVRRLELMDFVDCQYLDGERPEEHGRPLVERVARWAEAAGSDSTVALPAGAGWRPPRVREWLLRCGLARQPGPRPSPDHLFVRNAVVGAAAVAVVQSEIVLYEELPYRWGGGADAAATEAAQVSTLRAEPFSLAIDRETKARRIAVYRSQVPHVSPSWGSIDDPAVLPEEERYWRLVRP